jgi:hypothetical protein
MTFEVLTEEVDVGVKVVMLCRLISKYRHLVPTCGTDCLSIAIFITEPVYY